MNHENDKVWRHLDADLFQFATTDLHELRAAILLAFDQSSALQPSMGFDEVVDGIRGQGWDEPVDNSRLKASLDALVGWRLLDATQDHSARCATAEEFERRNLQWSLTSRGQAAVAGFIKAFNVLRSAVSLQPAVLDAIADGIAEISTMVTKAAPKSRITTRLFEVEQHHEGLVASIRQFNGQLQRLLRDDAVDDDVFLDVKRQTISYLKEYVRDLERPARRLASNIRILEELGIKRVHQIALAGANLAPGPGRNPGDDWLEQRRRRWHALTAWFAPPPHAVARIESVRRIADDAILELLRVLDRRWEARRRSASIERDFRRLALWFGEMETEETAHRLFHAAFGLWPARHADILQDDSVTTRDTTWCEATPVLVTPSLRKSGSVAHRGRPPAVPDPSRLRADRQRRQARVLERDAELRKALTTDGTTVLSALNSLPTGPFAELLALVGAALSAPVSADGTRRATTTDARVEIVLAPPKPSSPPARLRTANGTLTAPDYGVEIRLLNRNVLESTRSEQRRG